MIRIGPSAARRDEIAEQRAQAERDAGISERCEPDNRKPFDLDLRVVGGPFWHCEPRGGYITYRVRDEAGTVLFCAPPKTILLEAAKRTPRPRVFH